MRPSFLALVLHLSISAVLCSASKTYDDSHSGGVRGLAEEVFTILGHGSHSLYLRLPAQADAFSLSLAGWSHDDCSRSNLPAPRLRQLHSVQSQPEHVQLRRAGPASAAPPTTAMWQLDLESHCAKELNVSIAVEHEPLPIWPSIAWQLWVRLTAQLRHGRANQLRLSHAAGSNATAAGASHAAGSRSSQNGEAAGGTIAATAASESAVASSGLGRQLAAAGSADVTCCCRLPPRRSSGKDTTPRCCCDREGSCCAGVRSAQLWAASWWSRMVGGFVGIAALAGVVTAASAVCANHSRTADREEHHQQHTQPQQQRRRRPRRQALPDEPLPAWILAEMRAAEADKTESELAGVVRRLKPQQQGTRLDCAICLRKVVGRSDNWVVLPCTHGLCARCFTKLVAAQDRMTHCPLCRKRVLEDSASGPSATAPAAAAAAAAQPAAASQAAGAVPQPQQSPPPASGDSTVEQDAALAAALAAAEAAIPAAPARRSVSLSSNDSTRGRRAWWRPKDKPRPPPQAGTVAYLRQGDSGEEGVWAQMGSTRIWLPRYRGDAAPAAPPTPPLAAPPPPVPPRSITAAL